MKIVFSALLLFILSVGFVSAAPIKNENKPNTVTEKTTPPEEDYKKLMAIKVTDCDSFLEFFEAFYMFLVNNEEEFNKMEAENDSKKAELWEGRIKKIEVKMQEVMTQAWFYQCATNEAFAKKMEALGKKFEEFGEEEEE